MSGAIGGVFFADAGKDTHLTIWQGASIIFNVGWPDEDITGWTAVFKLIRKDGSTMLEISSANGGVTLDTTNRLFWFKATPADSSAVDMVGTWQIKPISAAG